MIITKTPFRMSFLVEELTWKAISRENGGAVLSTTFD